MTDSRLLVFNADGSGRWLLQTPSYLADDAEWTTSLQSPTDITVTLSTERPHVDTLTPWLSAIAIEVAGDLRAFGVVTDRDSDDHNLTISCQGLSSYPYEMPWTDDVVKRYDADPGELIPMIWDKIQSHRWGNLGVTIDRVKTNVRVGIKRDEVKNSDGGVEEQAVDEPYLLTRTETHDLGDEIDSLFAEAGLEWRENVAWRGEQPSTHIQVAPTIGRRRHDVLATIGVNVVEVPSVDEDPDDYASHVMVIGAGEGTSRIVGDAWLPNATRLRRVHVHQAQDLDRQAAVNSEAARVLSSMQPAQGSISSLVVMDHPSLPIWSLEPGDEFRVTGDSGQAGQVDRWVRIISIKSSLSQTHIRHLEVADLL